MNWKGLFVGISVGLIIALACVYFLDLWGIDKGWLNGIIGFVCGFGGAKIGAGWKKGVGL